MCRTYVLQHGYDFSHVFFARRVVRAIPIKDSLWGVIELPSREESVSSLFE